MRHPELRLGYELIPEIMAEHVLKDISSPKSHQYVLSDLKGRAHSFDLAAHPVYQHVLAIVELGEISANALRVIASEAAYNNMVSQALNAGAQLSGCAVCCAPIGLIIDKDELAIKSGCEVD